MKDSTKGAIIVAISSIFFGSYGVWAKLIGSELGNLFQVYARSLLILLIIIPFGVITKTIKKVHAKDWKWILLYTLAGSLTVAPIFYSYNTIGIGPATLLFYASFTVISFLLGCISFGEKITIDKVVGLIFAMAGLYLIFDLSMQQQSFLAAFAAVLSGSAAGVEVVYTKKVSSRYSAVQLSIYTWAVIFVFHLIGSLVLGEPQEFPAFSVAWFGVFGYAIAALGAFAFVVIGYRYVQPAIGALTGLLEIIFGIAFGILFFQEHITTQISIGAILIFLAAAIPNIIDLKKSLKHNTA